MWHYVIHEGTGTILDLAECVIVGVKESNKKALDALETDEIEELIEGANEVWAGVAVEEKLEK